MPTAQRIGSNCDLRSYLEGVLDKTKDKKETNEDVNDLRSKIKTYLIESNNPNTSALVQDKIIIKDTKIFLKNKNKKCKLSIVKLMITQSMQKIFNHNYHFKRKKKET